MGWESFISINIDANGKIIDLKIRTCFWFFENTFNKKVPLSGNSDIYIYIYTHT